MTGKGTDDKHLRGKVLSTANGEILTKLLVAIR